MIHNDNALGLEFPDQQKSTGPSISADMKKRFDANIDGNTKERIRQESGLYWSRKH